MIEVGISDWAVWFGFFFLFLAVGFGAGVQLLLVRRLVDVA